MEKIDLKEAHNELIKTFHEFSESYCYFVLSFSYRAKSQSKDRFLFEVLIIKKCIYAVTIDIISQILSLYNVPYLIIHELERVFRTEFFKAPYPNLFKDPLQQISFRFLNSLENPITVKNHPTNGQDGVLPRLFDRALISNWEALGITEKADEDASNPGPKTNIIKRPIVSLSAVRSLRSPLTEEMLPTFVVNT